MSAFFKSKIYIAIEFCILCLIVPGYIIYSKSAPFMFFFLWSAAAYSLCILLLFYREHIETIWKFSSITWENLKPILLRFVLACIGMTIFLYLYDPDRMLYIVHERPHIIPFLFIAYPLISALPQELVFCSFFFERYKGFFGKGLKMVAASAIIFAYAHILYINPVAPTLSLIAGVIFALTYLKTRSLALVTLEHGLYGNFLFIIGLGYYFHGGSVPVN